MSRYPEAQAHYRFHFLTHFTTRRRERGTTDTGFPYRVAGTTPLLPTRFGNDSERDPNDAVHPHFHHWVHSSDHVSHRRLGNCSKRNDEFGRAQNTGLGGSDPTFDGFQPPKPKWGRSRPSRRKRDRFGRVQESENAIRNTGRKTKRIGGNEEQDGNYQGTTQTTEVSDDLGSSRGVGQNAARPICKIHRPHSLIRHHGSSESPVQTR